uniref:Putative chaperonin n=1 Tax=viral metagenome TaxID=1070528 RepID=A0A6H1ZVJ6_9ZZZZ
MDGKIRPINRHVALRVLTPDEKKTGLLVVPDRGLPDDLKCEVTAVADDVEDIQVGDVVLVPRSMNRYDAAVILIEEEEVLCKFEN